MPIKDAKRLTSHQDVSCGLAHPKKTGPTDQSVRHSVKTDEVKPVHRKERPLIFGSSETRAANRSIPNVRKRSILISQVAQMRRIMRAKKLLNAAAQGRHEDRSDEHGGVHAEFNGDGDASQSA